MPTASTSADGRLDEPVVLLFERSPMGTLDAIVQHDGKTVYFYLNEPKSDSSQASNGSEKFGTRACWVRNLSLGPMVVNEDEMKQGISPMLPRTLCVNRDGLPVPNPEQLKIIWLEEGNGAALIEETPDSGEMNLLAMIPPWSGLEGFHGYASECAVESPLCWPMPDNPKLQQRIEQATDFWEQWKSSQNDPFAALQPKLLSAYDEHFGAANQQAYFSIDGGKFPPRGLVQYTQASNDQQVEQIILATVGMSVCPQPAVEIFVDDPANYRRIELAIRVPKNQFDCDSESTDSTTDAKLTLDRLRQSISGLANYPWSQFTWLGPGHTCSFDGAAVGCPSALLIHDHQLAQIKPHLSAGGQAPISLPVFRGDPINLLWIFPIEPHIQEQLQSNEMTIEQFFEAQQE